MQSNHAALTSRRCDQGLKLGKLAPKTEDPEDEEPDSLTKDEMMALDQHEGVSVVTCQTFPYVFIMPEGTAGTVWSFVILLMVLLQARTRVSDVFVCARACVSNVV